MAALGALILWFGWFGFNGGSNGAMDEAVPLILINTFLAASFGLLTGLGISFALFKKPDPYYVILGPLAGLVAITAGCNSMTSVTSIFVGIIGAVVAIFVNEFLNKLTQFDLRQTRFPEFTMAQTLIARIDCSIYNLNDRFLITCNRSFEDYFKERLKDTANIYHGKFNTGFLDWRKPNISNRSSKSFCN